MPKALTSQLKHSDYIYASDRPTPPLASSLFPSNNMHTDNSPTSPTTSTRGAVRANPLHRGEACLTCRRRKMKCDAAKPSCGPCSRVGKADECEYEESRFLATIARLEEQVQMLQERIRDLESGGGASTTGSTFTAFLPGGVGGRRTPSDGSTGSPYPFAAPALPSLPNLQPPPSTYHQPHAHHQQHQQFEQLPAIVTTPTHEQAPGQGIGGGLGLHTEIQPNILQRLLGLFMPHATSQFGLPASSSRILGTTPTAQALTEAACAVACAFAPRASGLGGYERTFFQRCEAALSRSAANLSLYDVQAMVVLAVQAFGAGRPLEGHRHLGAAVRVALAMGLHQRSNGSSESERETWWMVYRAERAWAFLSPTNSPVIVDEDVSTPFSPSISSTSPGTPYTVKQEYSTNSYTPAGVQGLWSAPAYALDERQGMESAESLGAKSAAVGARAWELVKEARNGGGEWASSPGIGDEFGAYRAYF
ncbi:hypothetical protein EXIGLDRAFT_308529 [Exidia glandulosa HHB12029]|uniref:Zn(2)-C6 fungal-type domain-containing protein n=1 Tax=Exidia glandulosa HHB12029 TaxID=1314781 RepID=A0A165LWI3_EXIGL|nr:hypothetical protein EXIGLDRAFT_308529 [Exidia glandulosa HHB12029]